MVTSSSAEALIKANQKIYLQPKEYFKTMYFAPPYFTSPGTLNATKANQTPRTRPDKSNFSNSRFQETAAVRFAQEEQIHSGIIHIDEGDYVGVYEFTVYKDSHGVRSTKLVRIEGREKERPSLQHQAFQIRSNS